MTAVSCIPTLAAVDAEAAAATIRLLGEARAALDGPVRDLDAGRLAHVIDVMDGYFGCAITGRDISAGVGRARAALGKLSEDDRQTCLALFETLERAVSPIGDNDLVTRIVAAKLSFGSLKAGVPAGDISPVTRGLAASLLDRMLRSAELAGIAAVA